MSSIAGGLISPKISSGFTDCWRFNWARSMGDSAHGGLIMEGFFGESSSESEYLKSVTLREGILGINFRKDYGFARWVCGILNR